MIAVKLLFLRYANGWRSWVNAVGGCLLDWESENHCPDGGAGLLLWRPNIWVEYAGIALFFVARY